MRRRNEQATKPSAASPLALARRLARGSAGLDKGELVVTELLPVLGQGFEDSFEA